MIKLKPQEKVCKKLKSRIKTKLEDKKIISAMKLINIQTIIKTISRKKFIIFFKLLT